MGTYAEVFILYENGDHLFHDSEDELGLHQSYDAFAVLLGVRNFNDIVPMFEVRGKPDYINYTDGLDQYPYDYSWVGHFTLAEFDQFDLDQPLAFKEDKKPLSNSLKHRAESVKEGDTYRSFIERETPIFEWIEKIRASEPPVKLIGMIFG